MQTSKGAGAHLSKPEIEANWLPFSYSKAVKIIPNLFKSINNNKVSEEREKRETKEAKLEPPRKKRIKKRYED